MAEDAKLRTPIPSRIVTITLADQARGYTNRFCLRIVESIPIVIYYAIFDP